MLPVLGMAPDRTLLDCTVAFDQFISRLAMLTNQDYDAFSFFEDLIIVSFMPNCKRYVDEMVVTLIDYHSMDDEAIQATQIVTELVDAVHQQIRHLNPQFETTETPYYIEQTVNGLVFLKQRPFVHTEDMGNHSTTG